MKIPKTLKIGAYEYKVVIQDGITHKGFALSGLCECDELIIRLDKKLKGTELQVVFIHECLHAIEHSYNIKLGEKTVERLDNALVAFFKDNNIKL